MTKSSKHRECKRIRYGRSEAKFMYDFFEKIYSETDTHFNSRCNPTRQNHAVYVSKLAVVLLEPRLRSVTILSDDYKIFAIDQITTDLDFTTMSRSMVETII